MVAPACLVVILVYNCAGNNRVGACTELRGDPSAAPWFTLLGGQDRGRSQRGALLPKAESVPPSPDATALLGARLVVVMFTDMHLGHNDAERTNRNRVAVIPIRIRQFPAFVWQTLERSRVLGRPDRGSPTFHLCFFSCQSYFRYLYCSLHSLVEQARNIPFKVLVFSDDEQPLSAAQVDAIRTLIPAARVIPWPKSMGWGVGQIGWVWRAYRLAAEEAADDEDAAELIDGDAKDAVAWSVLGSANAGDGHA